MSLAGPALHCHIHVLKEWLWVKVTLPFNRGRFREPLLLQFLWELPIYGVQGIGEVNDAVLIMGMSKA
jgi:hypothetical protein